MYTAITKPNPAIFSQIALNLMRILQYKNDQNWSSRFEEICIVLILRSDRYSVPRGSAVRGGGHQGSYLLVTCWLVLHGPLDLCGEPPAAGHPALLMLACPVSNKQDDWSHIIVLLSVLGIGYFTLNPFALLVSLTSQGTLFQLEVDLTVKKCFLISRRPCFCCTLRAPVIALVALGPAQALWNHSNWHMCLKMLENVRVD